MAKKKEAEVKAPRTVGIKPVGKRIIIRRDDAASKVGEIFLPEDARERPKQGVVVAVGNGWNRPNPDRDPMFPDAFISDAPVKVNDKVLFNTFAGTDIEMAGERLLIVGPDDILAVVEE